MKNTILIFLFCAGFIVGCNSDDTDSGSAVTTWHLTNISGGLAGVNQEYAKDTILWYFSESSQTIIVENNNNQNGYDGLETGTYNYSFLESNGITYIRINASEMESYLIKGNEMVINQNEMSGGNGADGFIITLTQ